VEYMRMREVEWRR